jgi:MFS family permease
LLQLGFIGFCSMGTEGTMFDWSGVYFKEVVKAPPSLVVLGYTSFMVMMASGRFLADRVVGRFGRLKVMQASGLIVSSGLLLAALFPQLIPCTLAFMLVGVGVSSIIPTVYSLAGQHPRVGPSVALATVSSVSFLGFLLGPPLIGTVATLSSLRTAFALIAGFGLCIPILVSRNRHIT